MNPTGHSYITISNNYWVVPENIKILNISTLGYRDIVFGVNNASTVGNGMVVSTIGDNKIAQ